MVTAQTSTQINSETTERRYRNDVLYEWPEGIQHSLARPLDCSLM